MQYLVGQATQSRLKLEDLNMARRKAVDVTEEAKTDAVVEEATDQVTESAESAPAEVEKAEDNVAEEPAEAVEAPAKEEAVVEEPAKEEVAEPAKKETVVKITSASKPKTAPEAAKEENVTDKTNQSEFVQNVTIYYTPTGNKVLFSKYSGVVRILEKCKEYTKVSVLNKATSSFVDGYIHI